MKMENNQQEDNILLENQFFIQQGSLNPYYFKNSS